MPTRKTRKKSPRDSLILAKRRVKKPRSFRKIIKKGPRGEIDIKDIQNVMGKTATKTLTERLEDCYKQLRKERIKNFNIHNTSKKRPYYYYPKRQSVRRSRRHYPLRHHSRGGRRTRRRR